MLKQTLEDGRSFLTVECTANLGSDFWNDPSLRIDEIWNECKRDGIVREGAELAGSHFVRIPTSYKVRSNKFQKRKMEAIHGIREADERIIVRESEPFLRREIFADSKELTSFL